MRTLGAWRPGSNVADHRLRGVTASGELIRAVGTDADDRLAELMDASNPLLRAAVGKVKTRLARRLG